MKRVVLSLVLLASAATPALAEGDAVDRALGGVEWKANPANVRLLGAHADEVLVAVASDPAATPMRVRRAIVMMEHADSPAVRVFLRERYTRLRDARDGRDALELAALLPVLARLQLIDFATIQPLLTHPVANLRESVAVALMALDVRQARISLRQRLLVESDSGVRVRLNRLMTNR